MHHFLGVQTVLMHGEKVCELEWSFIGYKSCQAPGEVIVDRRLSSSQSDCSVWHPQFQQISLPGVEEGSSP